MNTPKNILLIQFFSNGDCLYATAVARQIKHDFPGCRLTWAIADFCKNIIDGNPFVDEVMVIENVKKTDSSDIYKKVKELRALKGTVYDEVFETQDSPGRTHANFDGYIRSRILISYPGRITVPLQPVLQLAETEKHKALEFYKAHRLDQYTRVILFEFAPLSGQVKLEKKTAVEIAEELTTGFPGTAVILSSAEKIATQHAGVIDGSSLSLRETAALTHYCHYLLGCSSGITWITTSDGAKMLPMVQLIDPAAIYLNSPANDFKKFKIANKGIIELHDFSRANICACFESIFIHGFTTAAAGFHRDTPLNFKTTGKIVYNLFTSLQWKALFIHWRVNNRQHGFRPTFVLAFIKGIVFSPFYFLRNKLSKCLRQS